MRKLLIITALLVVAAMSLNNCGSGGGGSSSSPQVSSQKTTVTINLGQTRSLSSYAKGRFVTETSAIPPAVASIRLTVTAPDMNPVSQVIDVAGRSSVSLSFELQNGQNRDFVAEALNASGIVLYRGETFANLDGTPLHLTIVMVSVDPLPPVFAGLSDITDITETSMRLSWSPATDEVTPQDQIVYLIFVSTNSQTIQGKGATAAPSFVTDPGATSFTLTNLIPDTEYFVKVQAMDQKGNRDSNNVTKNARTKIPPDTIPPTFEGLDKAEALSESEIKLTWKAASDNVTDPSQIDYLIYMSVTPGITPGQGSFANPKAVATGVISATIGGLSPNTTYYFIVRARDKAGNVDSNTVEKSAKTPDTTPPSKPGGLNAIAVSPTQIDLSWTASTDNIGVIGYKVYRNGQVVASSKKSAAIAITSITSTHYSDTGLTPNTQYCYQVSAIDANNNESPLSDQICTSTQAAPTSPTPTPTPPPTGDTTPPSAPTGLTASAVSSSQIDLSWTASTDNVEVIGYKVYRNGQVVASSKKSAAIAIAAITSTTYDDTTGLTPNTQYCYQVSAYDAIPNESAKSNQACATTPAAPSTPDTTPPTTPTGLKATAVSSNQINLMWNPSTDNVGVFKYNVYRDGSLIASVFQNSMSNTALSPSTTYCYAVEARDLAGNTSPKSVPACATTFAAPPPLPDLFISRVWDICGDGCSYFFDVRNGGILDATNVTIYAINGYLGTPTSCQAFFNVAVPVLDFVTLPTYINLFSSLDYYIIIDPDNTILEGNETNNTACGGLFCTSPPVWPTDFSSCF